jgi:murein DD-endopeptidase MepM/ murein hydrolase activator NlpD
MLGQRYAYDFVGIDLQSKSVRFYRPGPLRYLTLGVRLQDCYGWGRPIFSASAGTVVQAKDDWPERNPVHPGRDLAILLKNAWTFDAQQEDAFQQLAGNYIIIETGEGYAVYAHAQTGSIGVSPGDKVEAGQQLARVGHSGNSTAPHLHFHIMDHQDPRQAQGILCCFREYEVFQQGRWQVVENGIPKAKDRIRKL